MTKDEILKIKEHIEIHARREPQARRITEILWKAVGELERIDELEAENEANENGAKKYAEFYFETNEQLTKAKKIIKKLVDGVRVLNDPKVELTDCDGFLAEAEQFLNGANIILEDALVGNSPFDADEVFHKEMKAYTD